MTAQSFHEQFNALKLKGGTPCICIGLAWLLHDRIAKWAIAGSADCVVIGTASTKPSREAQAKVPGARLVPFTDGIYTTKQDRPLGIQPKTMSRNEADSRLRWTYWQRYWGIVGMHGMALVRTQGTAAGRAGRTLDSELGCQAAVVVRHHADRILALVCRSCVCTTSPGAIWP